MKATGCTYQRDGAKCSYHTKDIQFRSEQNEDFVCFDKVTKGRLELLHVHVFFVSHTDKTSAMHNSDGLALSLEGLLNYITILVHNHNTTYYYLPQHINHHLPSSTTVYHHLTSSNTAYHQLSSYATAYHQISSTIYQIISAPTIICHRISPPIIIYHSISDTAY